MRRIKRAWDQDSTHNHHWNFLTVRVDSRLMLLRSRHYLLALLIILQSVSAAWAQVQVIGTPPAATQVMQPGEHCEMMGKHMPKVSKTQDSAPSKSASACPCCDKSCTPAQCAAMQLQAALPSLNIVMQFTAVTAMSSRFSQVAGTLYLTPPTPPPNAF